MARVRVATGEKARRSGESATPERHAVKVGGIAAWFLPEKTLPVVLLLAALAGLIYANSLRNGFVFDDGALIVSNPQIRNLAQYPEMLKWDVNRPIPRASDVGITHRPLRTALLAVEYQMFGLNPAGYRAVNILLHAVNGALVFLILRLLLGGAPAALCAALLFVVHPIQTDSVAYISGQRDVLFTTWYLLGFWGFVRYRATQRLPYLGLAGLAYILGLMTKEMAITLPVVCAMYDLIRRFPGADADGRISLAGAARKSLGEIVTRDKWLYAGGAAVVLLALYYFVWVANPSHQQTLYGGGLGPTLNTSARIMVFYLKQLVVPVTLNADYSYDAFPVSTSVADIRGLLAAAVLAGVGYGIYRLLCIDRWAGFGGLWFFVTLLPVSQIIPHHELVAEHFLYLPSIGFSLVVGYAVHRGLEGRYAAAVGWAFTVVLLLLSVRTVIRNRDWADNLTLYTKTVQTAPRSTRARLNLAQSLKANDRYEEAIEQFLAYSAIDPDSPSGHVGLGDTYRILGRYEEAVEHFRKAIELNPTSAAPVVGLTQTYAAMGQIDRATELSTSVLAARFNNEKSYLQVGDAYRAAKLYDLAVQAYRKGLDLNPYDVALQMALGKAYIASGRHDRALEAYREAVRLMPGSAVSHTNLAAALLETGRTEEAIAALQEAIRLSPDYADAHNNLGIAYHRLGRQAEAEASFKQALALKPDSTEFRTNLAMARVGSSEPSVRELERAARADPTSAKAHFNLGSVYGNQGDLTRAAHEFQRALELDPGNARIHYAVGLLRYQQGDRDAARQAWERALGFDPSFAPARERLAELGARGRAAN